MRKLFSFLFLILPIWFFGQTDYHNIHHHSTHTGGHVGTDYQQGGGVTLNLLLEDGKPMLLEDSKNILLGKSPNKPNVYIDFLLTLNNPKNEEDTFVCAVICKCL